MVNLLFAIDWYGRQGQFAPDAPDRFMRSAWAEECRDADDRSGTTDAPRRTPPSCVERFSATFQLRQALRPRRKTVPRISSEQGASRP